MSETTEWVDEKYQRIYDDEVRGLERRRQNDPECTIDSITGTLRHLYKWDGTDMGRGPVQDVFMTATIAAHEYFINEWKKELQK
jgi:hypothetical protein